MGSAATVATRARELPPGTRLGRYTLRRRIGRGGMAELYLAEVRGIEGFEKVVAIKLVLPHVADDPAFVSMFLDEARLAARLDHPNIVQVLDLGVADGEHFMAMEYVHGRDLRRVLGAASEHGGLPLSCALTIVAEACAGLHYAHELEDDHGRPLHVVHRDISPSNVIVRYDGGVKVVDFGIAKAANRSNVTRTGIVKGKAGYMSPEQCRCVELDRRSDVFGLGILLAEATTCRRLFVGDNDFAVINRIVDCDHPRPGELVDGYPPQLEAIVMRALAKEPEDRYPTALALRLAIEDFAHAHGLRLSTADLAVHMSEIFGEVVPPGLGTKIMPRPLAVPSTEEMVSPSISVSWLQRRRTRHTALGLGVGAAALLLTGYIAGTSRQEIIEPAAPPPSPPAHTRAAASPVATTPSDSAVPNTSAPVTNTTPEPVPEPENTPTAPAAAPDMPEPEATSPAPPSSSPKRGRPRKRSRGKKQPRPEASRGPSYLEDMMPREDANDDRMMPR